jgi:hypothetical protein
MDQVLQQDQNVQLPAQLGAFRVQKGSLQPQTLPQFLWPGFPI